jgi:catecholate siderophore receptor
VRSHISRPVTAFLALSCVGLIAASASAQTPPKDEKATELEGVTVTDTAVTDAVKVERVQSPKYVRPILDTPQAITVIGNTTIREQNLLTLRDALQQIPGITFGAGEGGFGYGDNINFRGSSGGATTDLITVDGVRSSAFYSRNETFNIEQIEVFNGANSVASGAGSAGGTINLSQKYPKSNNQTLIGAGIGTDDYYRGTIDSNVRVSDLIAVRLNAVYHHNDFPRRDVETSKRWGIAPSATIGIGGPTSLTFAYQHLRDEGYPSYGVPYYPQFGGMPDGVRYRGYYGFRNVDQQNSTQDQLTMIARHEFSDKVSIRNLTRYENVGQYTITSQPAGTICLASGLTPAGVACTVALRPTVNGTQNVAVPPGYFLPTGGRGNGRRIRNETGYDQLDLSATFDTGGLEHTLTLGASALWENYSQKQGSVVRTAQGYDPYAQPFSAPATGAPAGTPNVVNPLYNAGASLGLYLPMYALGDPNAVATGPAATTGLARTYGNNIYNGPINFTMGAHTQGEQTSYAVYLFDAIKITDWLELNGGGRYERVNGHTLTQNYSVTPGVSTVTINGAPTQVAFGGPTTRTRFNNANSLWSYRAGLVVKPTPDTSIYASMANSRTPSKVNVNGSCAENSCNVSPEASTNYEVGAKADLFNKQLQLNIALFRNQRDKYRIASGDPTVVDQVLDGKSRVDGITLGATGNITPSWTVFGNYTFLDSKLVRSVSKLCLANPSTACGNTAALPDPGAGSSLQQTPRHSGSIFTTYALPFGLKVGYGATYQGKFALNVLSLTNRIVYFAPDYLTHRLFASYTLKNGMALQVNVNNLTNEKYFTTVRNSLASSWAQPGSGRQVTGTLSYAF